MRTWIGSIAVIACCVGALRAQPASDDEGMSFSSYFNLAAREIDDFLQQRGVKDRTIAVTFSGPATWKSSGSNMLVERLKQELDLRKIRIDSPAHFAFKGDFKLTRSGKLRITGTLVDRLGDVAAGWFDIPACVEEDPRLVSTIMGLSADLMPGTGRNSSSELKRSFLEPSIAITDESTIARPSAASSFGVQVLVGGKAKKVTTKAGLAYVDLDLNDTYALKVVNDAGHEVAAAVTVDGLSVFHFSEQRKPKAEFGGELSEPLYRYYIFGPKSGGLVQGWDKNATTVKAFHIVPFEECAAVQSGQTTDIGMITVSFQACWEKGRTEPPPDEDRRALQVPSSTRVYIKNKIVKPDGKQGYAWRVVMSTKIYTKLGTGFGHDILVNSTGVQREVGAVRGLVTLRYARK